jgi:protein-S-isoprenylcysteine O-methyltransferase Ste14
MAAAAASIWLVFRALLWAVALPGFFGFYVPWQYFGLAHVSLELANPVQLVGLLVIALGTALLSLCIFDFARSGRGTLSPLDPPKHLVVAGLYRFVRNPMYLSVTLIVLGEVVLTRSSALLAYWALWFAAVNVFVLGYEEPALRRRFGQSYENYLSSVGRWIPRFHAHVGRGRESSTVKRNDSDPGT